MTMSGPGATQDIANRIAVTRSYVLTACLLVWVVFLVCCLCWSHPKPEAARARIAELQANLTKTAGEPPVAGQRQTSLAHISCKPKNPIYRIDKAPNRSKCLVHIIYNLVYTLYIYICMYMYMYIYVCLCMYIYIYTHMHMCIYIQTYIHACIHTYIHTYIHTHIYIYSLHTLTDRVKLNALYIYIHMYIYTYVYVCHTWCIYLYAYL